MVIKKGKATKPKKAAKASGKKKTAKPRKKKSPPVGMMA
jgi:hypothetical protein